MTEKKTRYSLEGKQRTVRMAAPMEWTCGDVVWLARLGSHGRELCDVPS